VCLCLVSNVNTQQNNIFYCVFGNVKTLQALILLCFRRVYYCYTFCLNHSYPQLFPQPPVDNFVFHLWITFCLWINLWITCTFFYILLFRTFYAFSFRTFVFVLSFMFVFRFGTVSPINPIGCSAGSGCSAYSPIGSVGYSPPAPGAGFPFPGSGCPDYSPIVFVGLS